MKKVITYWTFDVIHEGHINILKNAKSLWDYLIVWLSTDEFNKLKWKKSFQTFEERKKILENIKYVDKVIPEKNWEQKEKDIKKYNIDIFTMWSDWEGKFDELNKLCKVIYLPRTQWISSTKIRKNIFSMYLKKTKINILNNSQNFKKTYMKILSLFFIPFFYILSFLIKKDKNIYIFWSMTAKNISWNSKVMYNFYKNKKQCFHMTKNKNLSKNNNFIYIYSLKAIKLILKAQYIFTDSSASSVSPSLALLWNFKIVRLWHWDTIKKINFDSKKFIKSIGLIWKFLLKNEYKNNVVIPCCSEINKKIMNSAFISNKAHVTWLPRNDIFFEKTKKEIFNWNNYLKQFQKYSKIFLYTPTWRDTKSKINPFSEELLQKLNNYLKENNYLLIISWHTQTEKVIFQEQSNIINLKWENDTQELLVISDVLITDYSSIFIDYLLTNKPIIFYAYDIKSYLEKDREMYFDYNEVILKNTLTINEYDFFDTIKNIEEINKNKEYKENYKRIKDFFHKYQDWWYSKKLSTYIK